MIYPTELTQTYEIYEQIGAGGGGTVYRARHKRLQKTVVIKKLKGTATTSVQDCRTEVDILKNLRHSYLPQVIDFIDSAEGIFTVMDYIPGKSLQNMLEEGYCFKEKEVLKYTKQLCEVLDYLHSENQGKPSIIHGDIKPDNIMITPEGNVCLIDFNISGMLEGKGAITYGYTPGFSAPEQVAAFHKLKQQMQKSGGQKQPEVNMGNEDEKTELLAADSEETVLLSSEDSDRTVLLSSEESDETVLLQSGEEDRTVLLQPGAEVQKPEVKISDKSISMAAKKPEGIRIDKRSDVYSLGATIYTLLTGKWYDFTDKQAEAPDISDGFFVILRKALESTPGKRYQDAGQMLKAVLEVHKKDRRYKRLVARQILTILCFMICGGASVVAAYKGFLSEKAEWAQSCYSEAVIMYEQGNYEETLSLLIKEALANEDIYDRGTIGNLYYMAAECFFELEEFEAAVSYYEKAVLYNADSAEYYCNYAIALVRLGKEQEASYIIETAKKKGVVAEHLYLMQGELFAMQRNVSQATEQLELCIQSTNDAYVLARAYMVYSDLFAREDNYLQNEELLQSNVMILEQAIEVLHAAYLPMALERLIEAEGALFDLTKNSTYAEAAVAYALQMKELGWDTFEVYINLGMSYGNLTQYEEGKKAYLECLDKFGENYIVYKKLAFLELEEQNAAGVEQRNYGQFAIYYLRAMELFEKTGKQKDQDMELALLEENYKALTSGGWLQK